MLFWGIRRIPICKIGNLQIGWQYGVKVIHQLIFYSDLFWWLCLGNVAFGRLDWLVGNSAMHTSIS